MSAFKPERYRDLVSAVSRCVTSQGGSITISELPDEANYPAVFTFRGMPDTKPATALFLFFPTYPMLTSEVITRIFDRTNSLRAEAPAPVILLSAPNLPAIQRVLQVSGLSRHCAVGTYTHDKEAGFSVQWPASPPVQGA